MSEERNSPGESGRGFEPGSVHVMYSATATRVVLAGQVDASLRADLADAAEAVADARRSVVQVDAQQVTFMDSIGVSFLARLASLTRSTLVVIRPPEMLRFLFAVTDIGGLLEITEDDPGFDEPQPGDSPG